jgi:hypothetical protein
MGKEGVGVSDKVAGCISPPIKNNKQYGAILSASVENAHEVTTHAIELMGLTKKPIMIIIGGKGDGE